MRDTAQHVLSLVHFDTNITGPAELQSQVFEKNDCDVVFTGAPTIFQDIDVREL
jgi:hypothetical protein